ncbi:hypothetical protein AB3U99_04390 [Niallia sp. JL1B1071]|uniref:hypothetical protein n=1 Tax=Niallia tiangongensis TaxID=3237105 RepID=UPI0037DCF83C
MVVAMLDESRNFWGKEGKVAFIKGMKTTIQGRSRKSGVHQGDENHNPKQKQEKWRSSSKRKPKSKTEAKKKVFIMQMNAEILTGSKKKAFIQRRKTKISSKKEKVSFINTSSPEPKEPLTTHFTHSSHNKRMISPFHHTGLL